MTRRIAFQGEPGAYSQMACRERRPDLEPLPCQTFEDAMQAVAEGAAEMAMIPIENSLAGRVADIHYLLPETGLSIVGEHFLRVRHKLLGLPDADIGDVKAVRSHPMALGQCRRLIRQLGLKAIKDADTAGAARHIAETRNPTEAALASELAGEIYGLKTLVDDAEDAAHNTTRFVMMQREALDPATVTGPVVTAFVFQVRNVPAALYKAMGGFATNGVNMTKLESYQLDGSFTATQFYAEIDAHPDERGAALALEELGFFCSNFKLLGVFPADPYRQTAGLSGA